MAKILVLGADRLAGLELVGRLSRIGTQTRAAYHSKTRKEQQIFSNVENVQFDFSDRLSLEQALKGIDELFIVTPDTHSLIEYVKLVLECALRARVSHIVYLSILGAQKEGSGKLANWHGEAEELVRNAQIPGTILRPNCFMQNLLSFIEPKSATIYLPLGEASVSFVDVRDVAAVASDILLPGDHHYGKTYELTGPQIYSMHQIAHTFSQTTAHPIGYVDIPPETARIALQKKYPPWRVDLISEYFTFLKNGGGSQVSSAVEEVARIEPVSFIDFIRDYAENVREILAA